MDKSYIALPFDVLDDAEDLTDEELGSLIRYMARYAETGEESGELTGAAKFMRRRVVNTVDRFAEARDKRTRAGAKGGKANGSKVKQTEANGSKVKQTEAKRSKRKQTEANGSKAKPNTETETETEADTEIKNENTRARESKTTADVPSICQSICDEFNRLTGGNYRPEAHYIGKLVIDLLDDGYTEDDMITVIRKKNSQWKNDPEMRRNITPPTVLNRQKFGAYLDEPDYVPQVKKSKQRRQMEEMAAAIRNPFESEVMRIDSG